MDGSEFLKVFHTGYSSSIVKEKHKAERNLELLYQELKHKPNNSDLYFYLIESLLLNNDVKKAYDCCDEVFRCHNGTIIGIYEKTYLHKLSLSMHNNEDENIIIGIYEKALEENEFYPDFDEKMQTYYYSKEEYNKVLNYSKKCVEKMNNYEGNIESWALPKAKDIYTRMGEAYEKLDLKDNAIEIWIEILNNFKDDEYSLFKLMNFLKETESKEDILSFFKMILNFNNPKERLILIRAAIRTDDLEFSKYVVNELKLLS